MADDEYSLWAMPSQGSPLQLRLSALMTYLSSKYDRPLFDPHVTVLGSFGKSLGLSQEDIVSRVATFCNRLNPYLCNLVSLESGSSYFQCVYILVGKTQDVMNVHDRARDFFHMSSRPYMPHLSLIYGDLSEEEKTECKKFVHEHHEDLVLGTTNFMVSSLVLMKTDTNDKLMKTWEKLAEFPLGKPQ